MASFFRKLWFRRARREEEQQQAQEAVAPVEFDQIDIKALMGQSPDDIIDRFLTKKNLKIVVDDAVKAEGDVSLEPSFSPEDDIVSEELAEIYLSQGLNDEAIAIYRKLSLLNSEKSVYFAELISKVKNK